MVQICRRVGLDLEMGPMIKHQASTLFKNYV